MADIPVSHPLIADVALLDIDDICAATRLSRSYIHQEVRAHRFPEPIRFGNRFVRWSAPAVRQWILDRSAEAKKRSDEITAALVERSQRANAKRHGAAGVAAAE